MTADIELLPLPEADGFMETFDTYGCSVGSEDAWGKKTVKDYARAVAEHNVASRDAEIEALRAEVERLGADSRMQAHMMELVQARAERAEAAQASENERLRTEVERVTWELMDATTRAERLAEALRDALECGNDGDWQSARQYITAALRDHDQEPRND